MKIKMIRSKIQWIAGACFSSAAVHGLPTGKDFALDGA